MARVGGDITEITFNHPTLGSGSLFPKADEDSTYDLGGFRTNDEASSIAGDGQSIDTITRARWIFEALIGWSMNNEQELEAITAMAGHPDPADWTFTNANGTVYGAKGKPVGDLPGNGKAASVPLKVSGGGTLSRIV